MGKSDPGSADDVIKSGKYVLDANYSDVFTWTNFNSKEIIFAIPYDEIYGTGNQIHMKTLDPLSRTVYPMNAGPWGGNCAVPQFIDTYDAADTRLADTWIMGPQKSAATGAVVITYNEAVPGMEKTGSSDGFRIGKYKIKPNATGSLDNDFPFLRYADVLMIKAEGLLRTGKAAEAAELVTQCVSAHSKILRPKRRLPLPIWRKAADIITVTRQQTAPLPSAREATTLNSAGFSTSWAGNLPPKRTAART
jgi:hypothetical protein